MASGTLIFLRKGDFYIIQSGDKYYINVLFPNFYPNTHFDVSKNFLVDIGGVIEQRDFDKLNLLAEDIRKNYQNYKDKEVKNVEIVKRELIQ